jgi:hypothetical protein
MKPSKEDRSRWVVDPETGEPLPPRAQPGYYPGYRTLDQASAWDEATRRVVEKRVREIPPIRFFSPDEQRTMEALCETALPQDDRDEDHRIPIVPFIDERLWKGRGDGYRYEDMPPDGDAYRLGIEGVDAIAEHRHGVRFAELDPRAQSEILRSLHDGSPDAGHAIWSRVPAHRFFLLLLKDVVEVYYAHPYAWDEIGFGGPAYPRGYMRLERGEPEPWEVRERRYAWQPSPAASTPIAYEGVGGSFAHHPMPGRGGTH